MAPMPIAIRTAQTLGITASALAAGTILSMSALSVPSLLLAPGPMLARQWQITYNRGSLLNPGIALISVLSYGFLSYRLYGTLNHPKAEMYALSAFFVLGILPYTRLLMWSTNVKLFKKSENAENLKPGDEVEVEFSGEGSTKELVDKWGAFNFVRSLFPLVGAVLGTWTTIS